ncbi:MAG: transcription-repair coupling factor [Chlamydiota bacterium]
MWGKITQHPFFQQFKAAASSEPALLLEELWDVPKAVIAVYFAEVTGKNVLIITGDESETRLSDGLNFFAPKAPLSYPSWEILPGEEMKPSPDIMGKRFDILRQLHTDPGPHLVQAPLQAVLQKVCAPHRFQELFFHWEVGTQVCFDHLPTLLTELGYRRETVAADKGQFAIRGGIIDLFPVSAFDPYRIDFFGDAIDQIRTYDPISQKSTEKVSAVTISPADELALLRQEKKLALILDYLGAHTAIFFDDLLAIEDRYAALKELPGMRTSLMLSFSDLYRELKKSQQIFFSAKPVEELGEVSQHSAARGLEKLTFDIFDQTLRASRIHHPFTSLPAFFWSEKKEHERLGAILEKGRQMDVHFLTSSKAEEKALKEKIGQTLFPLPVSHSFQRGYLPSGFVLPETSCVLFPYPELTKRYKVSRQKWRNTYHTPAADFHALEKGDLVVHFHNGIGKFLGIETQKNPSGEAEEFFAIEYAGHSKLFVPLSQAHLLTRYIGERETLPQLSALGTKQWQKAKARVEKTILGYARDLLQMQALREAKGGFSFSSDSDDLLLFEDEFPFVPTEDQLEAVAMIKRDMQSIKAMDRLVCGDVGYGKTEVAMRAAFKAVVDGQKQVAVLVPTTVLAMQHYETFVQRMASFPIRIGVASRFVKKNELSQTLEGIATGSIDILIGTHRLISKDVSFHNLGLIIIDEEQRFGVRAKEHLKKVKIGVDCLTLSATPIPRTLYLSLVGARDISVINTPPQDRLPIKTVLAEQEPTLVQNALMRELARSGQAYIIHNRVESIGRVAQEIEKLIPKANVAFVHAQMSPDTIDALFHAFKQGEIDILIATTIVENGIDIPNANTILINRADTFGMADLYQLRGRVGRWNRPAYAYFLVPPNRELPEISRKRLQALVETSGFGGGMKLAMRDLEIRGAGDLLGVQQSGSVSTVGFHFYCKMLKRTIAKLKHEIPPSFFDTRIDIDTPASLPATYIEETALRLEVYHRLGEVTTSAEIDTLFDEIADRFGPLPPPTQWLYHISRIRIFACNRGFTSIKFGKKLTAELKQGDQTTTHSIPFPPCDDPALFEKIALELLQRLASK